MNNKLIIYIRFPKNKMIDRSESDLILATTILQKNMLLVDNDPIGLGGKCMVVTLQKNNKIK